MSEEAVGIPGRMGPAGQMFVDTGHSGESGYSSTTGLDLDEDWTPDNAMHGLLLNNNSGSSITGNVDVTMIGGGRMVVEYTVADGYALEIFRGYRILTLHSKTTSTFKNNGGHIFPLY